ncbi:FAD-binding domain-containing protein [Aquabacterium sp. OR-4]|uniref:FAD-binding domain-containing protein n=1 Tax=Aquabacterium sp. OR-4 TaxID=2978127 RepID=UPI0021B4ADF7|nr:FAD-binding domain-containing protein [Aquabacterium sp. OR-4]MDT7836069.1 FAD-binding domain-containing protein [Aquabacterium sp. OR-4]
MPDDPAPTLAAAQARIAAVRPAAYARTRNALDGAVSGLSPYLTHGLVSQAEVLAGVNARHPLEMQHRFVAELGWRSFFRHVWQRRGDGILRSLHGGVLPDDAYGDELPADIRLACTGVPVIDQAVRTLYATGLLHNHARLWLASYVVHVRQVHWRVGADWLYGHLLDGDLASNHLSWQWVAATGSRKPYLFNAENVARFAPAAWHSPGTVIDTSYDALAQLARRAPQQAAWWPATAPTPAPAPAPAALPLPSALAEPPLFETPSRALGLSPASAATVRGRDVWLVHPWNLGALPAGLPHDTLVIGLYLADFHQAWPWSERRWRFVNHRMAEITPLRWHAGAATLRSALAGARSVRSVAEPHLAASLPRLARCEAPAPLFAPVETACDSFSAWWARASRGLATASELLAAREALAARKVPAG